MSLFDLLVFGQGVAVGVALMFLVATSKWYKNRVKRNRELPHRSRMSLKERMADLGLEFKHRPNINFVPVELRGAFGRNNNDETLCRHCHNFVDEIVSKNPAINPCHLGYFCTSCGEGRLFASVDLVRQANGMPCLPNGNLFSIVKVLERVAFEKGILREPTTEQPKPESFDVILQETAGYRGPPLKARVDIESQTVTLVDETAHSGQPLRLVK